MRGLAAAWLPGAWLGRGRRPVPVRLDADTTDLIDVKQLIARYSGAEHAARADAYFAGIPDDDKLLRKPFFGITDTQQVMHGLAEVLQRLQLFPGARVLDFGAGTGWLSRVLACLDCQPIALDVSASALGLGQRATARDPVTAGLAISWQVFDGTTLPLGPASVDRIVCYDSFHHVADQAAILREFHRVLAEGGRAVFHEPGPTHSLSAGSQYEMRHHDVIENDIVVEQIWAAAEAVGFSDMTVALTAPRSLDVPLARYRRVIDGSAPASEVGAIVKAIVAGAENLRIFTLTKGHQAADSRFTAGLAGRIEVTLTETVGDMLGGHYRVTNIGSIPWRPSDGQTGAVSLGVYQPDRRRDGYDFGRIALSDELVCPGQTVARAFKLQAFPERPLRLAFDLVAEEVTWFEPLGSKPVYVDLV